MKPNRFTYRIFVNRPRRRVTVQKRRGLGWETVAQYPCAVGSVGHETPGGVYKIKAKILNPPWWVPDTQWARDAGLTPKSVIPGGAENNPIKGAFLQVTDNPDTGNVGIHGTADFESLGTAASHGCIRVKPEVAIHLYRTIPKRTRVEIL